MDGTVTAWGYDTNAPYARVPTNLNSVRAVAAGWNHSVALRSNGTLVAWGYNTWGQTNVPGLSNVTAIAAGAYHTLALKSDGTVVAWGLGFANTGLGFDQGQSPWLLTSECRNFYAPSDNSNQDPGDATGEDPCTGANGGHGTRIGATISGFHPGGDGGNTFYGCAPKVPHVVVRISNSVLINDQLNSFAKALNYLVNVAQVDTVNLSMGAFPRFLTSQAKAAINNAYSNGVILVCAGGQHVPPVVAPACFGRTIAVGGTTSKDQVWAKSSRGPEIDWSAPAADIRRATTKKKDGPFVYGDNGDGTSYATALSTGVAALWLTHRHAMISAIYGKTWRRVNAFKQIAKATARVPPVWGPGVGGTGILDAYAVLAKDLPRADALTEEPAI